MTSLFRQTYPRRWATQQLSLSAPELDRRHPLAQNLLAWWPLAGNGDDWSGNNNHGTLTGGDGMLVAGLGPRGKVLSFEGGSVDITIQTIVQAGTATPTTPMTFAVWVFPLSLAQQSSGGGVGGTLIESNEDGGNNGWTFGIENTGVLWFWPAANEDVFSSQTVSLNQWTHIAVTIDTSNNLNFYFNGMLESSITLGAAPQPPMFFKLGAQCWTTGQFMGPMQDARLYTAALTASQISALYNQPFAFAQPKLRRSFSADSSAPAGSSATATAAGTATVSGASRVQAAVSANSQGSVTVFANGLSHGFTLGSAQGSATVTAPTNALLSAAGTATGVAVISGVGASPQPARGNSQGTATVSAIGLGDYRSTGSSTGSTAVAGSLSAFVQAIGTSVASATSHGMLRILVQSNGQSSGQASVSADTHSIIGDELTIHASLPLPIPSFTGFAAPPGYLSPITVPQKGLRVEAFYVEQVVNVVYAD